MTKNLFLALLLSAALPLTSAAQQTVQNSEQNPVQVQKPGPKVGYFSYGKVLKTMDGYLIARHNIDVLRNQYKAEAKRSEDDFNAKYEAFLDEQEGLATNIRRKRQAELMDLMEKNSEFKAQAEKLIADAEKSSNDSLCRIIDATAKEIGIQRGYAYIINSDNHNLPFVNPQYCEDITAAIEEKLAKH